MQDRSSSGETLFVEPLFAVESNNRLLIAAREEAEEEARVLTEITQAVGSLADALEEAFGALVDLDTLAARAHFARRHDAVCPEIGETGGAIIDLLFSAHRRRGTTLVLITHDPALARRCDRVLAVRDGRVAAPAATADPARGAPAPQAARVGE